MLNIEHLTKRYGDTLALDDLSFTMEEGRVYGLLGPNGAGKSTTMNIMTGYIAATEGDVEIDGHDILKDAEEAKKYVDKVNSEINNIIYLELNSAKEVDIDPLTEDIFVKFIDSNEDLKIAEKILLDKHFVHP